MIQYVVVKQSPQYHQMSLEEFLFGNPSPNPVVTYNETNTRTYEMSKVSEKYARRFDMAKLYGTLKEFNEQTAELREKPRDSLYTEFWIPKSSGGLRKIDNPCDELKNALRRLKIIFEEDFKALYHTSAFAYVKGRSTVDAMKRHQQNKSKWFGHLDLHGLFPSTTLEFVMRMFSMVYPFSAVIAIPWGKEELEKALSLAFLNGGLPQGTPVSPLITNIMMIPIDYKLTQGFRNFQGQHLIYTRYADDFTISAREGFNIDAVRDFISGVMKEFDAPYRFNEAKTRYGSSAGRNWNLGLMLNGENQITVGHKKKRQFQAMLSNYIMDRKNGISWDAHDIMVMDGHRNYYRMVEKETIDGMIAHLNQKFGVDVVKMIKEDLSV